MRINCKGCGTEFETVRKKQFCSKGCRVNSYLANNPLETRKCPHCSVEFTTSKPDKKYCSKKCLQKAWSANPKKKASIKAWCKINHDKVREYRQKKALKNRKRWPSTRIYIKTDPNSGEIFISKYAGRIFKNKIDGKKAVGLRVSETNRNFKTKKICHYCQKPFIGYRTASVCVDCAPWAKKTSRLALKAKKRGALVRDMVNPFNVYTKYNWHCVICGCHTPKDKIGTNDADMPTIDHILPISRGGEHSYNNTQLLCFECNTAKGVDIDNQDIETITLRREYIQLNKHINEKRRELNHC